MINQILEIVSFSIGVGAFAFAIYAAILFFKYKNRLSNHIAWNFAGEAFFAGGTLLFTAGHLVWEYRWMPEEAALLLRILMFSFALVFSFRLARFHRSCLLEDDR
jgi:hypothetical protein